jgi:hypothetical protein
MQNALATHLAIKEDLFAQIFHGSEPAIYPVITEEREDGVEPGKQA